MAGDLVRLPEELNKPSAIVKIADSINQARRDELIRVYSQDSDFNKYVSQVRAEKLFKHGNKSKSMRKIASMPRVVDEFFTKLYGSDYFKDPDFFVKTAPEWAVIDPKDF